MILSRTLVFMEPYRSLNAAAELNDRRLGAIQTTGPFLSASLMLRVERHTISLMQPPEMNVTVSRNAVHEIWPC